MLVPSKSLPYPPFYFSTVDCPPEKFLGRYKSIHAAFLRIIIDAKTAQQGRFL